jgi:hypothetical protein
VRSAERQRRAEEDAIRAEHEQFMRDVRGDHDGPRSYMWLPPAESTPTAAEVLSQEVYEA